MADDIGRSGEDPREVAARRRAEGEARRAAQRGQGMVARARERTAAGGGSGGGGGGRALTVPGASDPVPSGGRDVALRGNRDVSVSDRRIPLSLGSTGVRAMTRAVPVVGALADAVTPTSLEAGADFERAGLRQARAETMARNQAEPADGPAAGSMANRAPDPAPAPAPAPRPAARPAPRPAAPRARELSADDLNAMVLERLNRSYEGARPPEGADASRARARIDEAMGMKKGGPVRMAKGGLVKDKPAKMASGGKVRGDGICSKGKTKGRMV